MKKKFEIELKFEPRDFWIGVYWDWQAKERKFHIYICLLPLLPIHITLTDKI